MGVKGSRGGLLRITCEAIPGTPAPMAARYDTCVVGTDPHGNGVVIGLHLAH
jgi:hypothetical protein